MFHDRSLYAGMLRTAPEDLNPLEQLLLTLCPTKNDSVSRVDLKDPIRILQPGDGTQDGIRQSEPGDVDGMEGRLEDPDFATFLPFLEHEPSSPPDVLLPDLQPAGLALALQVNRILLLRRREQLLVTVQPGIRVVQLGRDVLRTEGLDPSPGCQPSPRSQDEFQGSGFVLLMLQCSLLDLERELVVFQSPLEQIFRFGESGKD